MAKEMVSIVIPVYNEVEVIEKVIDGFYREVYKKLPNAELIVAEDGSTDGTKELLKKLAKKYPIKLHTGKERKGYLKAVRDALQLAKGDWVFFCDSDATHDPKDFWKLYNMREGYDIITGIRTNRGDSFNRKFLSKVYNTVFINVLFGLGLSDTNVGFKLMKKDVVNNLVPKVKYMKYGFSTELLIRAKKTRRKIGSTPVKHFERKTGSATQFSIKRLPRAVLVLIKGMIILKFEKMN